MLHKITYRRALQDDWDNIARVSQVIVVHDYITKTNHLNYC